MKKSKSLLLMIALVLVIGTVLAGCGGNNNASSGNNTAATNAPAGENAGTNTGNTGEEKLAADQTLRINLSSEPPTFDPQQAQDSTSNAILKLMYEGLTRQNAETGQAEEGVAESWDISADGLVYTFHLRDSKWSNGDAVTANDFAFAWQRVLDPNAEQAAPYAYQLYYIKGAEDFNTGKITDFSQVGIKVIDEKTLEVTLANPTPYFLGLLSFYTYYPVHSSVKDNAKWATTVDTQITNGPFTLTEWTTGQSLAVTKNPSYYAADDIKAQQINFSIVNSGATELLSYKNGELDRAGGPIGEIPTEQLPIVEKELPNEFARKGIASVYYYQFNVTEKPFDNAKIRKALAMAIERQPIIDNITLGGQLPAFGFVPPGIQSNEQEYRAQVADSQYFTEDLTEAKKLLDEGLKEEGLDKLEFTITYNTSEGHQKIAVAIADQWKKALGVEVKLENKEWGVFIEDRHNLNYQVARAGWSADYNDPMTYLDMWVTGGGNNDSGYSNADYDKLIQEAKTSADNAVRQEKFAAAEKILMDDMVVIPIYYYTNNSLTKEYLKGVTLDFSGAIDLSRAYLLEH
ncbi:MULTISPECIES: peptide ABC transporter substrate-binding protein [unclassified Paenibacillus]|uniref:peptide ABC transporter substrate-binding protein n=1 Tax=unclassified Paenibacillus TaxID=185978 RepID=UPI002406610C|nr:MULTISPECIES: peptide ABC transporter substrate-binding protein [unclassified Paenibacillus]MDF9843229.1 oligopeptide transport system substrate-binding protein [Paenibacillus sp. PastF-2]MDF9849817.1 oligopeptide transport system substrate-binding protein [Paenibacillus sp. PastM-2]MDF9856524.1 oligopeptide transport system substrate-binding protein [Paenibacillus sp. PastF-1]MDH6481794.1 oligopeptide transport system substrate-binding protein [Paenibacillus sp. PastH-2]MDH6509116.1 oligop